MFFAGFAGYQLKATLCDLELAKLEKAIVDAQREKEEITKEKALEFERIRKQLQKDRHNIIAEVANETKKPIYRDCVVPVGSVFLINKAVSGDTSSESGKQL